MKRIFNNKMTRRLVSAFLVLAMVITFIPVTDAQAKKKNYLYRHDFYTVDGKKTDGHREEIINTATDESEYGLYDVYEWSYEKKVEAKLDGHYTYWLNADEVKQLVAGKAVNIHVDRLRDFSVLERTNAYIRQLFMEISYTDKNGKRKNGKDFMDNCAYYSSVYYANGQECVKDSDGFLHYADESGLYYTDDDGDGGFDFTVPGQKSCFFVDDHWELKGPVFTDVDITLRLPSKAIYNKYTRFEMPKGDKGKKVTTYRVFFYDGNPCYKWLSDEECEKRETIVSRAGLEEPCEFYLGKGKWGKGYIPVNGGEPSTYYPYAGIPSSDKAIKNGETITIRGKYTHRKVTFKIVWKRDIKKLVYDKFEHKSQLGLK